MEDFKKNYIEKIYSLSKAGPFAPWRVEYPNPLDTNKKMVVYLENFYNPAGTFIETIEVIRCGESFQYILDNLFPTIASYPYFWPLEGQKIDPNGYDFYSNFDDEGKARILEITDSARVIAWSKLNIRAPREELETYLTQKEYVTGKHLAKLQITLAKAGPLSEIAFKLKTIKDAELLSFVYETDISKFSNPRKINLKELEITPSSDIFLVKFGKPIFVKRITMVLAQNNADMNTYAVPQTNFERMIYETKDNREIVTGDNNSLYELISRNGNQMDFSNTDEVYKEYLKSQNNNNSFKVYTTNEIYTDEEIQDWSPERKQAYLEWRNKAVQYRNIKGNEI